MYISVKIFHELFIFKNVNKYTKKINKNKKYKTVAISVFKIECEYTYRMLIKYSLGFISIFLCFIIIGFTNYNLSITNANESLPFQCSECDFIQEIKNYRSNFCIGSSFMLYVILVVAYIVFYKHCILILSNILNEMPF